MIPYVFSSIVAHVLIFGLYLTWAQWPLGEKPHLYAVDFLGGQSGKGTGNLEPAAAPPGGAASATEPSPAPGPKESTPQQNTVSVPNTKKKPAVKGKNKSGTSTVKSKIAGTPGGRGESPRGKGDKAGAETGPVGGVGTSLDIGGFGPGGTVTGQRFPYSWYVNIIYKKLWENWDKTDAGTQECSVSFIIQKDGSARAIALKKSSGDALFDMIARRAVDLSSPFPPLPEGYPEKTLSVTVRFRLQ